MSSELDRLCDQAPRVRAEPKLVGETMERGSLGTYPRRHWTVTLRRGRRKLTTEFHTGVQGGEPTAADALSCLILDARTGDMTFREWLAEFGMEGNPADLHDTWEACVAMAPKVRRFLGDAFEQYEQAEH